MMIAQVRHLSVSIARDRSSVYDFAADPENMPRWATGLGAAPRRSGDGWEFDGPDGPVVVRFTPHNEFGVLDHYVTLRQGIEVYVPMRVVANGGGCEVIFTLIRLPDMTDERFEADAAWVKRDLARLKELMEGPGDFGCRG